MELHDCDELTKKIFLQIANYNLFEYFNDMEEIPNWIKSLDEIEINNFLSLNIPEEQIKFDKGILIDRNLLKTKDYLKRVEKIVSIDNAEGVYHLFKNLITKDFLESERFYEDIEKLKQAHSAQIPLWIIGNKTFINSPYHDEDYSMLIDTINKSKKEYDYVKGDSIATLVMNKSSIESGYHQMDMHEVYNAPSNILQTSNSYPKKSINNLACDDTSLKDPFHQENMQLLKENKEIGNFLYCIMTDENAVKRQDYRRIISEMIEYKSNKKYVFLICCYVVGYEKAKLSLNISQYNYLYELGGMTGIEIKINSIKDLGIFDEPYNEKEEQEEIKEKNNIKTKAKTFIKNHLKGISKHKKRL